MENRFTPLLDANTPRVQVDLDLPFDLEKRVGIDLKQTELLMQVGGIRTLRISPLPETETSQAAALILGGDAFGEVLVGKADVNYVPTHNFSISGDSSDQLKQKRWIDLGIHLNIEELTQRFPHHDHAIPIN